MMKSDFWKLKSKWSKPAPLKLKCGVLLEMEILFRQYVAYLIYYSISLYFPYELLFAGCIKVHSSTTIPLAHEPV